MLNGGIAHWPFPLFYGAEKRKILLSMVGLSPKAGDLIPAFKQAIFKLLLKEDKISNAVIENMNSWSHDGFHVYCGKAIYSWDNEGLERLGQYIVRAPLSQERMTYIPKHQTNDGKAKVIY